MVVGGFGLALGSGEEACKGEGLTGRCELGRREPFLLDGEADEEAVAGVARPLDGGGPGGRIEVARGDLSGRSCGGTGAGR